jgi:hypothetical protein
VKAGAYFLPRWSAVTRVATISRGHSLSGSLLRHGPAIVDVCAGVGDCVIRWAWSRTSDESVYSRRQQSRQIKSHSRSGREYCWFVQHFLQAVPPSSGSGIVTRERDGYYTEVLIEFDTGDAWVAAYVIPIDEDAVACVTCWDQQFDPIFQQLTDPKYGQIYVDEFKKIWPQFFALIDNTVDERFGDGAITQLVDPDDRNRKWFVAKVVGGLQAADDSGTAARVSAAIDAVAELSLAIFREFQHELSWRQKAKIMARGGAVGYREGKAITGPWEERLGWLQTLIGP